MKAVRIHEHGGPDRLTIDEIPEPDPAPGEVVVGVRAVALNHLDVWVRRGIPGQTFPLPIIPGSDASGVVAKVGSGVEGWREGDEVVIAPGRSCGTCPACLGGNDPLCRHYGIAGESGDGGCAERVAVSARYLLRKPSNLAFTDAAAIPLDFLTAWHMLVKRAAIRPGETVLVQAGGSGVGSSALQIAKLWGLTTITTVGSADKAARARELGADEVIEYRETDFLTEVKRLTDRRGVDVVVEHVGGDTFERSLRALCRGGRLVTCGATSGHEVKLNLRLVFFKLLSILGSTMGSLAELHEIMRHVEAGRLHAVVDRVLPLERIAEGHQIIEDRKAFGKIVIEVAG